MCSKSPNYAWQAALGKNGHLDNDHLMKQQEAIEADLHAGTTPKPYAAYIEDSFFYPAIYDTRTEGKRGDVDSGAKFMWAGSGPDGPGAFKDFKDVLPPEPEDWLVMGGDIASLFVYSFLDHTFNAMMAEALVNGDSARAAALDPATAAEMKINLSLPVWYDAVAHSGSFLPGMPVLPALGYVPYSPAISTGGSSAVVITAAWLLAGYFSGAFLYKNTVECSTQKAIANAGRTWFSAIILAIGVALASDAWCDCPTNPMLGGLTKADADFLFGSLSVLAMWRFVLSSILGYGGSD